MERTLVLVKPDAVKRGLSGEIIARFERSGLRIVAMRLSQFEAERVRGHYPSSSDWLKKIGQAYIDAPSKDSAALEVGTSIRDLLVAFMLNSPLIVVVLEGPSAVAEVRKLIGATVPSEASPGTIRGDYSTDSIDVARAERRPIMNLVHASDSINEANREIRLWFDAELASSLLN